VVKKKKVYCVSGKNLPEIILGVTHQKKVFWGEGGREKLENNFSGVSHLKLFPAIFG